ncbi:hypothetical protein HJC23_008233 [Cyclotella cryptica]|uniref:Hexosyltransferase n=1 Tax=Cyclotella cryptica TaxID=29204 RepID=A0ABD3Q6Z3_9STRA
MKLAHSILFGTTAFSIASASKSASKLGSFVIDETSLKALLLEPPSFISQTDSSSAALSTDVISFGSTTRLDYLTAQIKTWASHTSIRHFWGFSELQDYEPECTSTPRNKLDEFVETCRKFHRTIQQDENGAESFFAQYYGFTEGNRDRTDDAGWVCAQRRVGRAFGWLHSQYAGGETSIPDYLALVDDDTYMDMVAVVRSLQHEEKEWKGAAFASGGCVFQGSEE